MPVGGADVDFLVNDLSMAGQFHDIQSFRGAVGHVMKIRDEIQRLGSSLYCHRKLAYAQVSAEFAMQQAVQRLPMPERLALMQWLTKHGPYWEDARLHAADDWLEVNAGIVTDTAVGEAAICRFRGLARELVSFDPSDWCCTPINVTWVHNVVASESISIPNHWTIATVQTCLAANPIRINSWKSLAEHVVRACTRLTFAENAFEPLDSRPFVPGAAERIQVLLHTLHKFKGCFNDDGDRTAEGHSLYTDHFTGDKAWFSDSSYTEKNKFKQDLTFPHPDAPNEKLFCTWHGKVKTPQYRIHFSWPVRNDTPLYVVYVGPKITM